MVMLEEIDPENKMFHKVGAKQVENLKKGTIAKVVAQCGKIWVPTYFGGEARKERCLVCFPHVKSPFVIAS